MPTLQALRPRIWIGFDLQCIGELAGKKTLLDGRGLLTVNERQYLDRKKDRCASLSGLLAAKEAFVKALSGVPGPVPLYRFTDIEVDRLKNGRPVFAFGNRLAGFLREAELHADVSITHSGNYAAAVVLLMGVDGIHG